MNASNFTCTGAMNLTVEDVNINLKHRVFKLKMYFPKITMNAVVNVQGNYRNIPLNNTIISDAEYGNE